MYDELIPACGDEYVIDRTGTCKAMGEASGSGLGRSTTDSIFGRNIPYYNTMYK
jgi:hypothetical protein